MELSSNKGKTPEKISKNKIQYEGWIVRTFYTGFVIS